MNEITTVYLIRHSEKINPNLINNTNNNEFYQNRREKIILSINGEKKAENLSKQAEFKDIDIIFSSNYARTIQTAKYFAEPRKMLIHIDERFNERKVGIVQPNKNVVLNQYYDEDVRNPEGESRKEVQDRMYAAFGDAVNSNKGKKIAIFTHGAAMTFLLMKWCKLEYINEDKQKCLSFKDKIIVDKIFNAPEVFRIEIGKNNEILSVENIEFDL